MADVVSPEKRSQIMAGIKAKDTRPELLVRKALHRRGFRYRLHKHDLPGKPDIYLPRYKAAIFVHGCFWHGHNCTGFRLPKTNTEFWFEKIESNRQRDRRNLFELRQMGVTPLVVWECETRSDPVTFVKRIDLLQNCIKGLVNP